LEVAENVSVADWSPTGELAVVTGGAGGFTLESPPGNVLVRSRGPISSPRFSSRGNLIAYVQVRSADDEVSVVDLQGHFRVVTHRPNIRALAWAPDDAEIWFTAGMNDVRDSLIATDLSGRTRDVYRSLSNIRVEDIASDGRVLLSTQVTRLDVLYLDYEKGTSALMSWTRSQSMAAFSADRKLMMSIFEPGAQGDAGIGQTGWTSSQAESGWIAVLRKPDGTFDQVLGEGKALDLSPDGRWALVVSEHPGQDTTLIGWPTGPGQPRRMSMRGFKVESGGRWLLDGKTVVVTAKPVDGSGGFHLYRLAGDDSPPVLVSNAAVDNAPIHLSPDGRTVAAEQVDPQDRAAGGPGFFDAIPILISLTDGSTSRIPKFERGSPRGWSREGHLWLTVDERAGPARARLLKVDIRNGQILEEHVVAPPDPTGTGVIGGVVLTPDGKGVAFNFFRSAGETYILHGLVPRAGDR
jgi:hypothetical protein